MSKIQVSVEIKKPPQDVYRIIKDMEEFPQFMRDVKNVKIVKKIEGGVVTAWETDIDGAPLTWKEEDCFDDVSCQIRFNAVEGSYKEYMGTWSVKPGWNNRSVLSIEAYFDWGIPILEQYVGKALEKKAKRGLLGMVQAIKKQAERNV